MTHVGDGACQVCLYEVQVLEKVNAELRALYVHHYHTHPRLGQPATLGTPYAAIDRAVEAETERDALAAQVAAIRALAVEFQTTAQQTNDGLSMVDGAAWHYSLGVAAIYGHAARRIADVLASSPLPPNPDNKEQP